LDLLTWPKVTARTKGHCPIRIAITITIDISISTLLPLNRTPLTGSTTNHSARTSARPSNRRRPPRPPTLGGNIPSSVLQHVLSVTRVIRIPGLVPPWRRRTRTNEGVTVCDSYNDNDNNDASQFPPSQAWSDLTNSCATQAVVQILRRSILLDSHPAPLNRDLRPTPDDSIYPPAYSPILLPDIHWPPPPPEPDPNDRTTGGVPVDRKARTTTTTTTTHGRQRCPCPPSPSSGR
jgi:hypothetical protein